MGWRRDLYWRLRAAEDGLDRDARVVVRVQYRDEVDMIGEWCGVAIEDKALILRTMDDKDNGTETHIRLNKHTLIDGVPAREWRAAPARESG